MTHEVICEVTAALLKGPRTMRELDAMCVGGRESHRSALIALRESGLVRIADYRRGPRHSSGDYSDRVDEVYEFQRAPFADCDAERPPLTARQKRYRARLAARAAAEIPAKAIAP